MICSGWVRQKERQRTWVACGGAGVGLRRLSGSNEAISGTEKKTMPQEDLLWSNTFVDHARPIQASNLQGHYRVVRLEAIASFGWRAWPYHNPSFASPRPARRARRPGQRDGVRYGHGVRHGGRAGDLHWTGGGAKACPARGGPGEGRRGTPSSGGLSYLETQTGCSWYLSIFQKGKGWWTEKRMVPVMHPALGGPVIHSNNLCLDSSFGWLVGWSVGWLVGASTIWSTLLGE